MKLLKIALFAGLICLQSNAETMQEARAVYKGYTTQQIAKATSEELASTAPMQLDAISYLMSSTHVDSTVVVNTVVVEDALKNMTSVDTKKMGKEEKDKFAKNLIDNIRKIQFNALCTTPMTRAALEKGVNYNYIYRWDDFTYLGEVSITEKVCVKSKL